MTWWLLLTIVIVGWLHGGVVMKGRAPQYQRGAVTMGHHYQRDTMFRDIMGM